MIFRPSVLSLLLALPLAAASLNELPTWKQGNEALASGLWEVATNRFDEALRTPGLSEADQRLLRLRRVEAWIRGDRGEEALEQLNQEPLAAMPEATFWRAQALAGLGRYREAVETLAAALTDEKVPFRSESLFTRASLQLSLNDREGALASLEPLIRHADPKISQLAKLRQAAVLTDLGKFSEARALLPDETSLDAADRQERTFLEARLLLAEGKAEAAASTFAVLLDQPQGQSLARYHAAALGLADALDASGNRSGAADWLLAFVQKFPDSPALDAIFKRLLLWLPEHPAPNDAILERLAQWSAPTSVPATGVFASDDASGAWPVKPAKDTNDLAAFALFTRAIGLHRIGTPEAKAEAERMLTRVRLDFPNHFLAPRALLQVGQWMLDDGRTERAFAALEAVRQSTAPSRLKGEAAFLEAKAAYDRGQMAEAAKWFDEAAASLDDRPGEIAELNAALARLQSGSLPGIAPSGDSGRDARLRTELELERALTASSREALERFLVANPDHARASEARFSVADAALRSQPPDLNGARAQLDALVAKSPANQVSPEDIEWLRLRIADLGGDVNEIIPLAHDFLSRYPKAPFAREAALVLGRGLFRNGDYNNARLTLEKLALTEPDSPLSQAALLLAARAAALGATAQSREEALALFQRVGSGRSPLAPLARLEHARLLIDRDRLDDAISALQPWFDALPAEDPLRLPVGLLLGEALYARGNAKPGSYAAALDVYNRLLADAKNQPALLARLHYRRGLTLEQLPRTDGTEGNRNAEALDSYYSVLQSANEQPPAEWEWFENCGFRALLLLESAGRWDAAIAVATKIASFNGPRASEAAARAKQLRLDHMIFEE
jgi:TolA-binding protein